MSRETGVDTILTMDMRHHLVDGSVPNMVQRQDRNKCIDSERYMKDAFFTISSSILTQPALEQFHLSLSTLSQQYDIDNESHQEQFKATFDFDVDMLGRFSCETEAAEENSFLDDYSDPASIFHEPDLLLSSPALV